MINFGGLQGGGFQNALAMGMQFGQIARQRQDAKEERNALAAFVTKPSDETAAAVAPFNPELAYRYGQDQREAMASQQQEAQLADLRNRALGGDDDALTQLASVNFEQWKTVNTEAKARATESAQILGNAGLQLLNLPYAQRRDLFIGFARELPQFGDKIQEVAFLPEAEQDAALRAVVAEAKMVDKLIAMERPDYQVLPQGADLVNTRDPNAVAQFQGGAMQPVAKTVGGVTYYQNPRTGQWFDNPQEAMGAR